MRDLLHEFLVFVNKGAEVFVVVCCPCLVLNNACFQEGLALLQPQHFTLIVFYSLFIRFDFCPTSMHNLVTHAPFSPTPEKCQKASDRHIPWACLLQHFSVNSASRQR